MLPLREGTCKNTFLRQFWVYQCSFSLDGHLCFLRLDTCYFCTPLTTLHMNLCSYISVSMCAGSCHFFTVLCPSFFSSLFSWPLQFFIRLSRRIKNAKRSYMQKKEIKFTSIWMLVLILKWSVVGSALSAKVCWIGKAGACFINEVCL